MRQPYVVLILHVLIDLPLLRDLPLLNDRIVHIIIHIITLLVDFYVLSGEGEVEVPRKEEENEMCGNEMRHDVVMYNDETQDEILKPILMYVSCAILFRTVISDYERPPIAHKMNGDSMHVPMFREID